MNLLPLVLLLVIPILGYRWANKKKPAAKLTVLGASWGLIASPFSMGLYSAYFIPYVGLIPGMVGLVSAMLHGTPGYEISVALGLIESHTVVENAGSIICYFIDAVFWAIVYGFLGFLADRFRLSKRQAGAKVKRGKRGLQTSKSYSTRQDRPFHDKGLFTRRHIGAGELTGVLDGVPTLKDGEHVLWLDEGNGLHVRCDLRFINHGDEPNAVYYDTLEACALTDMSPGEEITHDYLSG